MKQFSKSPFSTLLCLVLTASFFLSWKNKPESAQPPTLEIPVTYYKLDNGLKVVLSPDKTTPIIVVGVY